VTTAAAMALYGLPALRFLETTDDGERLLLLAMTRRAAELRDVELRNLATYVVNALAKAMR
jgi:hypothetical protein